MKITKFAHSCLLVEMPAPVNRTVLFDPGMMSGGVLDVDKLVYLDDIIITHGHPDHLDVDLLKRLVTKFPDVRITTTDETVKRLQSDGIKASSEAPAGVEFFEAPHEAVEPVFWHPEQQGIHYLDLLTNPGDSHSFGETKTVLAMPMSGPWGSMVKAVNLVLELKPKHVLPIHDWHLRPEVLDQTYPLLEGIFKEQGITLHNLKTGEPVVLDV